MYISRPAIVGLVSVQVMLMGLAAEAVAQVECRIGETTRRIELHYPDQGSRLPCEVLYWNDPERRESIEVLWRAEHTAGFCQERMDEFIGQLESQGWTCSSGQAAAPAPPAAPDMPEAPDTAALDPEPGQARPDPVPLEAVPDAGPPPAGAPAARPEARGPAAPAALPPADRLAVQEALERDLRRLNELTADSGGSFAARIGDLGDIDGDGIADAAVLMTFEGTDAVPTGYLVAYLFEDGIYRPVARAYIAEGDAAGAADARIDDEAVYVVMPGRPGQPSSRRERAFVLDGGKLLQVDRADLSTSTPPGRLRDTP